MVTVEEVHKLRLQQQEEKPKWAFEASREGSKWISLEEEFILWKERSGRIIGRE